MSAASTIQRAVRAERPPRARAAVAAAAGLIGLSLFELALALGAPLGRAAMGGTHTVLPTGLRIVSAFAALIWPVAALVVLRRGGYQVPLIGVGFSRVGAWVLVGLLSLGVLMNLASSSDWERFLQAPIALLLAGLCLVVARGGAGASGS